MRHLNHFAAVGEWLPESSSWMKIANQKQTIEDEDSDVSVRVTLTDSAEITMKVAAHCILCIVNFALSSVHGSLHTSISRHSVHRVRT